MQNHDEKKIRFQRLSDFRYEFSDVGIAICAFACRFESMWSGHIPSEWYDKPYSSGHRFSVIIIGFAHSFTCDFEKDNLATFDFQNGDF